MVSELLTQHSREKQSYQLEYILYVFSLVVPSQDIVFQSYLAQFLPSSPSSMWLCCSFVIYLDSFVTSAGWTVSEIMHVKCLMHYLAWLRVLRNTSWTRICGSDKCRPSASLLQPREMSKELWSGFECHSWLWLRTKVTSPQKSSEVLPSLASRSRQLSYFSQDDNSMGLNGE